MARSVRFDLQAFDRTKQVFDRVGGSLSGLAGKAGKVSLAIGAIGTAATAAFIPMAKKVIDQADKYDKLRARIGASTEALSQLEFAADITGVRFETLTMALQRMTRRVAEAAQGTGEARNALKELNLSAQDLARLAPEDQFEVIADAMAGVSDQSDKVRLAMKLFDSEGVAVLQTMEGGAAAIRALRQEADELGLTMDRAAVQGLVRAKDAMTRLEASSKGFARTLVVELGPPLADLLDWFREALPSAIDFAKEAMAGWQMIWASTLQTMAEAAQIVIEPLIKIGDVLSVDTETLDAWNRSLLTTIRDMAAWRAELALGVEAGEKADEVFRRTGTSIEESAPKIAAARVETAALKDTVGEYIVGLEELTRLQALDSKEREVQLAIQRAQNIAMKEGNLLTQEQIDKIRETVEARQKLIEAEREDVKAKKEATKETDVLTRESERLATDGVDLLTRSLQDNKFEWDDWAQIALKAIASVASAYFGGGAGAGGGGGGGAAGAIGPIISGFAGGLQGGGRMRSDQFAVVGEKGPEIFQPGTSGTVRPIHMAPAGAAGGGLTVINKFEISTGVQDTVRAEILSLMPQIEQLTTEAVLQASQRDAAYRRGLGAR